MKKQQAYGGAKGKPTKVAKAELKAKASAKRIARSGLTTRVRGHVSASQRRNQAARNLR